MRAPARAPKVCRGSPRRAAGGVPDGEIYMHRTKYWTCVHNFLPMLFFTVEQFVLFIVVLSHFSSHVTVFYAHLTAVIAQLFLRHLWSLLRSLSFVPIRVKTLKSPYRTYLSSFLASSHIFPRTVSEMNEWRCQCESNRHMRGDTDGHRMIQFNPPLIGLEFANVDGLQD